jgi:hypothetical protein
MTPIDSKYDRYLRGGEICALTVCGRNPGHDAARMMTRVILSPSRFIRGTAIDSTSGIASRDPIQAPGR